MALNSEYKEFFVRAVQMAVGAKKDRETGFLIDYQVTDVNGNQISAKNRFLKNHFPSEQVFKKLFNSVAFKLNPEDSATQDVQGLVRVVTGHNIVDRTNLDIDAALDNKQFTTVVVPSTLPIVSAGTNITITPQIRRASDNVIVGSIPVNDRGLYYVDYLIAAVPNIGQPFRVKLVKADTLSVDANDANMLVIGSHTIPANTLVAENDNLAYEVIWSNASAIVNSKNLVVYLGNSSNITLCEKIYDYNVQAAELDASQHIMSHELVITKNSQDGCFIIIKSRAYLDNLIGFLTDGNTSVQYGFLHTKIAEPRADTAQIAMTNIESNAKIDWTLPMYVHFRYKAVAAAEGATRFNIIGNAYKV